MRTVDTDRELEIHRARVTHPLETQYQDHSLARKSKLKEGSKREAIEGQLGDTHDERQADR